MAFMRYAELLTPRQVAHIHEASLQILEDVGMLVRHPEAREILAKHGCQVDSESDMVSFPRQVVEHFRAGFPATFTFRGRDPQYDVTIPNDRPVILTGCSALNMIDPVTGEERRARSDDMARIAHLINELPGYDVFSLPVLADDAPPGHFSLSRYYPALKNCLKPLSGDSPNVEETKKIIRLAEMVAGGKEPYRKRPLVTHQSSPCVSPLTLDVDGTAQLLYLCQEKLPGYVTLTPNAGLSSPLTLIGTLAQTNAEFLATNVLAQMIQPQRELIYNSLPVVTDMRSGNDTPGAIETGMLLMGCAQMARFYNVPSGGYAGQTNSKLNDAQSGYESGMSTVAAMLGGADMLNMGGLFDALMTFDLAKAVIDGEMGMMLKRLVRGYEEDNDEELALDVIAEVGASGIFAGSQHTFKRMKTTAFLPDIADRNRRQPWSKYGSLDAHARAMLRAREILTRDNPAVFSPDVDAQIRAEFEGLVAGDSVAPPEWQAWAEQQKQQQYPKRPRKQRRRRRREQGARGRRQ